VYKRQDVRHAKDASGGPDVAGAAAAEG